MPANSCRSSQECQAKRCNICPVCPGFTPRLPPSWTRTKGLIRQNHPQAKPVQLRLSASFLGNIDPTYVFPVYFRKSLTFSKTSFKFLSFKLTMGNYFPTNKQVCDFLSY